MCFFSFEFHCCINLANHAAGAFIKSNSFSTSNAKPKVKLVDEVVFRKQKSLRDPASLDSKEGGSRVMGKSMSFRSVHSGRLSSGESKVKMLSPENVPDLKGSKHLKDRSFVERKNSFKSERPSAGSAVGASTLSSPKVDKRPAARGDNVSFSSISNVREVKAVPSESKSTQSSRPVNQSLRKGSEVPVALGMISLLLLLLITAPPSTPLPSSLLCVF